MRLVDTSAWIEWLIDFETGKSVEAALPQRNEWLVPTVVQLELAKWLTREAAANWPVARPARCRCSGRDDRALARTRNWCAALRSTTCFTG
jgi:uncharacterized protein with PIN domain